MSNFCWFVRLVWAASPVARFRGRLPVCAVSGSTAACVPEREAGFHLVLSGSLLPARHLLDARLLTSLLVNIVIVIQMGYPIALLIRSDHILQIKMIVIIFPMLRIGLVCPLMRDGDCGRLGFLEQLFLVCSSRPSLSKSWASCWYCCSLP